MEPALDVINRSLNGDPGARSFLERTTSIYVLDVTDSAKPKTYGCWNFIHQAMNEVERHESTHSHASSPRSSLVGHARLLASMALKVSRRSPAADKALVATCIANASQYSGSESQSQWLIDLNLELREIVMGRIAAMAFDFSFHRKAGPHGRSAFADRVVMDTFCAILSANAVATGPPAIKHFATEWIIPSSRNLPAFAVASVVLHLASEGMRRPVPAGTKDTLQYLSVPVINVVLVPTLSDAVSENSSDPSDTTSTSHQENSEVAAMCLRAMKMWCDATDLSLPQIKHICGRIDANIVGVLSDAMYSDSHHVIDSLAELIESTVQISDDRVMSQGRMNQVRHILQVDEPSFKAQFTAQQLKTIESNEMASIVEELVSAIGLQRFRFTERQNKGDYNVCRNLARIAASVCGTFLDIVAQTQPRPPETGAISLLMKSAAHPSVNICGIALQVLTRMMSMTPSLSHDLLPVLQRRAITPHHMKGGSIDFDASDICGVNYHEFQNFRENVLADALAQCWRGCPDHFMASCVSAVEEFCSISSTNNVSLQLEAALFCIEKVSVVALDSQRQFPHDEQMKRLLAALPRKPPSLMENSLTRDRMCRFLRMYSEWLVIHNFMEAATDLTIASFLCAASSGSSKDMVGDSVREKSLSRCHEAALTLKELMCASPKHYCSSANIAYLSKLWDASHTDTSRGTTVLIEDRIAICSGICHVFSRLPEEQRLKSLEALAAYSLERLDTTNSEAITPDTGDEIQLLALMTRTFSNALLENDGEEMKSGCDTSPERRAPIPQPVLEILQRAWPGITQLAANFADDKTVAAGLTTLLSELLPSSCEDNTSVKLLRELCLIASSVLQRTSSGRAHFEVVFRFVDDYIKAFGEIVEKVASATLRGSLIDENAREVSRLLEDMILRTVVSVQESLGNVWTSPSSQQGNGQEAFESKPPPAQRPEMKSNESLAAILAFLKSALDSCPLFVLHLPSAPGKDKRDDLLIRRAIDSATASLTDDDPEVSKSAIAFLNALTKHSSSPDANLRSMVSESLTRVRADAIGHLILGSCGKYEYVMMEDTAELLSMLLRTTSVSEVEPYLVAALRRDHFLLGDAARDVALQILTRSGSVQLNPILAADLTIFLQEVWKFHRVESDSNDALASSDEVARFLQRFAST